ncbi:hypothetical protein M0R45_027016 [Rubus argutus]|uniref:Uncharacterized protein n=1 Tax=Rubus argutus TaxID=59490 RepID=A0AAW1X0U8_RUBAR
MGKPRCNSPRASKQGLFNRLWEVVVDGTQRRLSDVFVEEVSFGWKNIEQPLHKKSLISGRVFRLEIQFQKRGCGGNYEGEKLGVVEKENF